MTINRGVLVERTLPDASPPPSSPTVIAVIGFGDTTTAINTPILVNDVDDAIAKFGAASASSITAAVAAIRHQIDSRIIAVRFDFGSSVDYGAERYASVSAALDALVSKGEVATGLRAKLIVAPGETVNNARVDKNANTPDVFNSGSNTVFAKLGSVASDLKAVGIADSIWDTAANAVAWIGNNSHARILSAYPRVNVAGAGDDQYLSPAVAGLIARLDATPDGIASSPSNKILEGVTPGSVPVKYSYRATEDLHTVANAGLMAATYRNGMRTFGGELGATGIYKELPTLRIADKIDDETEVIAEGYLEQRNIGDFISRVNGAFQDYFDALVAVGTIAFGTSTPDVQYNSLTANRQNGRYRFNFRVGIVVATKLITLRLNQVVA